MRPSSRLVAVVAVAGIAIGAGGFLGLADWPQPHRTVEFAGLILAAMLASALPKRQAAATDWAMMPPSFIIEFTSLLLLGPQATLLVAAGAAATQGLTSSSALPLRRQFLNAAIVMAAIQAAGFTHLSLGGTLGEFAWPWQGLPIAGAVVAWCLVEGVCAEIVAPLIARQPINRSWPKQLLSGCPSHVIGAALAVGLVEVIDHRLWNILPVATVPLYFAYRAYRTELNRLEEERRRREVISSLDQGMSVVDSNGLISLWSDTLERLLNCPRERALHRSLAEAMPMLAKTELPRAIHETLTDRRPRTLPNLALAAESVRALEVRVLPVPGGVTMLWTDITERTNETSTLRRSQERLTLAAEGANDGLWEWDLRNQELYVSNRWNAMIGLPATEGVGSNDLWMSRVHADDVAPLKEALEAHLSGKTDHFQFEHRLRHEDGSYRRFLCRGLAVRRPSRRATRIAGSLTDMSERLIAQERVQSTGFLDPLTGLGNRTVFVERLGRRLDELKEQQVGSRFAALYLDLDRFKVVNDSLGHLVGDELLTAVSRRLETCLRKGDALARLGGDEFAILLNELADGNQANAVAFRIQDALSAPFSIGGREVFTSASIGIAFGGPHYNNPDEMMRDADTAMYHAKSRGKARHELYDADMHARELDRLGLENDLRHAVNQNDFEVHYQPIVLLTSGMCVGFESLVRWTRNGKAISPATFIPLAEELGIIEPLGTWVLNQACRTFAEWKRRFPSGGLEYLTVNVSSRQLMQQNFLWIVEQAVHHAGLQPYDLRLEITETALMDSPNEAAKLLHELRAFGVKIYLDDFGCGYSSLSHLHKLPVDALKIDRSFVNSLLLPDRPAIVESILALARTLNTSVVAEGIEEAAQAHELERLGCTHAQGYLFSRPLSTVAVEELLLANRPLGPKTSESLDPARVGAPGPGLYSASTPFEWPTALHPA